MKNDELPPKIKSPAGLVCGLMLVILCVLFWRCFLPGYVYFSNDGPLGIQNCGWLKPPQAFFGQWLDLYSMGWGAGASFPDADSLVRWVLHPVGYAKFYVPISLFILGYGAYFFFRRSGLGALASILGGLAACLTTNYFTDGAWGAAPAVVAFGLDFLALGALAKKDERLPYWVAPALAGLAVGFNVTEAADIGGLFSLVVAVYALYRNFVTENDELTPNKRVVGLLCVNLSLLALLAVVIIKDFGPVFLALLVAVGIISNWSLLSKGTIAKRLGLGVVYTWFLTTFAVFMAAYSIVGMISSSITGISGTKQDAQTKAIRWDFATQWSLPKRETLSLIVPGLFGNRVDYSDERAYWGGMGRDASWDRFYHQKLQPGDTVDLAMPPEGQTTRLQINNNGDLALPSIAPIKAAGMTRGELQTYLSSTPLKGASIEYGVGFMRHTGRGFYFGLPVIILGLWAALQSFRKNDSVFQLPERKMIWFWSIVAVISLLVAHGKFSLFKELYYWIYTVIPYSSTVRSPEKFLHVTNMSMLVLFAYGVFGLNRRYLATALSNVPLGVRFRNWWGRAAAFDRRWVVGSVLATILALVGWLTYAIMRPAVEKYLVEVQFGPELAHAITGYSLLQVAWFFVFLTLNCGLLLLIFIGTFSGRRAAWGGILLGVLLVWDLGRADMQFSNPWKNHGMDAWTYGFWNYQEKYEVGDLNPICKVLADKPYEHRVKKLPFRVPDQFYLFVQLYDIEWNQQIFPYYNIENMDIPQLPRYPTDMEAFERATAFPGTHPFTRHWELTNTRYLLGPAGYLDVMNQQLDPGLGRFRIVSNFRLGAKPGVENPRTLAELTAIPSPQGEYALFEFTGALPRVKLYSNWETNSPADVSGFTTNGLDANQQQVLQMVGTNDFLTLRRLMSPSFDPTRAVLLSQPIAASPNSAATNQNPGDVDFTSYAPTHIKLKANATTPCVLLLNDRYDPMWRVSVDGKPAELLRCNYIMRGVFLQPGQHEVEFRYRQPVKMLFINVAAIVVGIGLLGFAIVRTGKEPDVNGQAVKTNSEKTEKVTSQPR
jgi:hypothetical protein